MRPFLGGFALALGLAAVLGVRYAVNRQAWRDHADVKGKYLRARKNRWVTLRALALWVLFVAGVIYVLLVQLVRTPDSQ